MAGFNFYLSYYFLCLGVEKMGKIVLLQWHWFNTRLVWPTCKIDGKLRPIPQSSASGGLCERSICLFSSHSPPAPGGRDNLISVGIRSLHSWFRWLCALLFCRTRVGQCLDWRGRLDWRRFHRLLLKGEGDSAVDNVWYLRWSSDSVWDVGHDRNWDMVFWLERWGEGQKNRGCIVGPNISNVLNRGICMCVPLESLNLQIIITVVNNQVVLEGGYCSKDWGVEFRKDPLVHAGVGVFSQHLFILLEQFGILDSTLDTSLWEVLIWG